MTQLLQWAATFFLVVTVNVQAAESAASIGPHEVVRVATNQVMSAVTDAEGYMDSEPERFYDSLEDILDGVVDFRGFARGIMGPYASTERYRALDAAGRDQLREQLERFTEVMRKGLVRTYGKGLIAFGGSRIEVPDLSESEASGPRVAVRQLIYSNAAEPYVLVYHMGRDRDDSWKLRNLVIENVNLGEIYRNQFEAAARKHDGNLDSVIAEWATVGIEG
ncbi:MAG: ABC transporter substrate-binding protein [Haliea sp.]|jgi:phospholipid transport system substrate-binding protein|nr:ABC transporter substrate-binding protein [Haliea sp.]MDP4917845.1 ABC transporter substrate-binding protein [Haliea sp.]